MDKLAEASETSSSNKERSSKELWTKAAAAVSKRSRKEAKHHLSPPPRSMTRDGGTMERYFNDQMSLWSQPSEGGQSEKRPPSILPSTFCAKPDLVRKLSANLPPNTITGLRASLARHQGVLRPPMGSEDEMFEKEEEISRPFLARFKSRKKKKARRVCAKDGTAMVKYRNVSEKRRRYLFDIFTTLIDTKWSNILGLFSLSFYLTWTLYALAYFLICWLHGDFEPDHLPAQQSTSGWTPCIWEVDGFAASFLFSLETQHTIGYGSRQTTTECLSAMIVMSTQSVLGCLIQAFMVGLVFAKLSTPNKRSRTVVFSKNAVICERDRKLCLIFRVGDMRHDSFIVGAQLAAKIIKRRVTAEGEMFHDLQPLRLEPNSSEETCVFLIWPLSVVHVIDEDSPFYNMSALAMASEKFELHVSFEGTIESTSMTFQARTSYLPNEILWGHRFEQMMIFRKDDNKYQVNFSAFNSTYEVDTPLCSSRELDRYYKRWERYERTQHNHKTDNLNVVRPRLAKSESFAPKPTILAEERTISNQLPPQLESFSSVPDEIMDDSSKPTLKIMASSDSSDTSSVDYEDEGDEEGDVEKGRRAKRDRKRSGP